MYNFNYIIQDWCSKFGGRASVHFANGAHNSLFLIKNEFIKKVPITLGAKKFINDQEMAVARVLLKSNLSEYIPRIASYDRSTKVIIRQYIQGKTGHELIVSDFFKKNKSAANGLKKFFKIYKVIRRDLEINLDIHPGNFVWNDNMQKWFFIDTGPIPSIGSDYFPLSSFKKYFQKIWIERHSRMKNIPIRSVDLGL